MIRTESCAKITLGEFMGVPLTKTKTPATAEIMDSDAHLVALTSAGNKAAYQQLVERYSSRIRGAAFDILRNREEAEDITQETFVKAYISIQSFKGDSSFYTWLFRIAYNLAIDLKRKQTRRGGEHLEFDESKDVNRSSVEKPDEALMRKELGETVQAALSELSDEHRAALVLREVDGLSYDEISDAIGVPRGTVMSRIFYARKALQKRLAEFAPAETILTQDLE